MKKEQGRMRCKTVNGFLVDGAERAATTHRAAIKARVQARYAHELASVGFFRRLSIRLTIWREINRELDKIAPRNGLYGRVLQGPPED